MDVCTKPSMCIQSKSCSSSAAVSAHAHVVINAAARKVSTCVKFLQILLPPFQRAENAWPSLAVHTKRTSCMSLLFKFIDAKNYLFPMRTPSRCISVWSYYLKSVKKTISSTAADFCMHKYHDDCRLDTDHISSFSQITNAESMLAANCSDEQFLWSSLKCLIIIISDFDLI